MLLNIIVKMKKKIDQDYRLIGGKGEVGEFVDSRGRIEKRQGKGEELLLVLRKLF